MSAGDTLPVSNGIDGLPGTICELGASGGVFERIQMPGAAIRTVRSSHRTAGQPVEGGTETPDGGESAIGEVEESPHPSGGVRELLRAFVQFPMSEFGGGENAGPGAEIVGARDVRSS